MYNLVTYRMHKEFDDYIYKFVDNNLREAIWDFGFGRISIELYNLTDEFDELFDTYIYYRRR